MHVCVGSIWWYVVGYWLVSDSLVGDNCIVALIVILWDLNWSVSVRLYCQYCVLPPLSALVSGVFSLWKWDVFLVKRRHIGFLLILISFTIFMTLQCMKSITGSNLAMSHCSSLCLCARDCHWHTALFDSDCRCEIKDRQFFWKPNAFCNSFWYKMCDSSIPILKSIFSNW